MGLLGIDERLVMRSIVRMTDTHDTDERTFMFGRFVEMQQWQRVLELGNDLLASEPDNAWVHEKMGQAYLCLTQVEKAETHIKKALTLNPDSDNALYFLSVVQANRKHYKQADETMRRVIEMRPNVAVYWEQRARYAYNQKSFKKAKTYIQTAARLDPTDADIVNLGILIDEQLDEYDMTPTKVYIQRLTKALELDPENTDTLNNIGVHYLDGMKDPKTAEVYFRRALAIDPNLDQSRKNVLTAIRRQDPLFRFLYFPLDKGVMPILRFFQICWAKKWPIIFLLLVGKYLVVLGAAIFILWCVLFYPLIFAYRWMTLIDLRRKSNDLSLKLPRPLKPFFRLPKSTRIACFFGLWTLAWTSLAIVQTHDTSGELFIVLIIACAVLFLSYTWIQGFIRHRANRLS